MSVGPDFSASPAEPAAMRKRFQPCPTAGTANTAGGGNDVVLSSSKAKHGSNVSLL